MLVWSIGADDMLRIYLSIRYNGFRTAPAPAPLIPTRS